MQINFYYKYFSSLYKFDKSVHKLNFCSLCISIYIYYIYSPIFFFF